MARRARPRSGSDWIIISPSRQSSKSSWRELGRPDGGCIGDRRHVVGGRCDAAILAGGAPGRRPRASRWSRRPSGSVQGVDEGHQLVVRRDREALGVHLPQLRLALVPQLGVPGVVVAVGAEPEPRRARGRWPSCAQHLEQAHLDPPSICRQAGCLLDPEDPRAHTPIPRRERRSASLDQPAPLPRGGLRSLTALDRSVRGWSVR